MKALREDSSSLAQTVMAANAPMLLQRSMVQGDPAGGVMSAGQVAALIGKLDSCETVISGIVQQALENGKEKPDVIYLTGGSARSPLIKKALAEQLPGIPIAGGDDFGSVTAGLARWAQVMFS